ncbi:dihydroorotase-like protein [Emericellopsis cladophorae]|uniref:Dihydroorotase-like protein n=1 Tax=Emericellopsis cladophorae TaxID=2686198 RepID=A0A9P9Y8S1_9HYPO|nr:dihydroorotase-like protein [Emericellopsis cladophorae]KAI6784874.1 dihydroorotase-like protein [Emericellopsis cladophorae]
MQLKTTQMIVLPPSADMHVHLRQGEMMKLVTPTIRRGRVDTVFVMPNLQPPIRTVKRALEYKSELQAIEPNVNYLMSLYFHADLTPDIVAEAANAGIAGIKVYPQGVTTKSDAGVVALDGFDAVFEAMQEHDLVLNLHGEVVGTPADGLTHEEAFLPTLKSIHNKFPRLQNSTITAHHLYLTGEMSNVDPHAFCKPNPKTPQDRDALPKAAQRVATASSSCKAPPAGVFTQLYATQLVVRAFEDATERGIITESDVTQEKLEGFFSKIGRAFYKLADNSGSKIVRERKGETIPTSVQGEGLEVGISRSGDEVFSLGWHD